MAKVTPDQILAWGPVAAMILQFLKSVMKMFPAQKTLTAGTKQQRQIAAVQKAIKELSA